MGPPKPAYPKLPALVPAYHTVKLLRAIVEIGMYASMLLASLGRCQLVPCQQLVQSISGALGSKYSAHSDHQSFKQLSTGVHTPEPEAPMLEVRGA